MSAAVSIVSLTTFQSTPPTFSLVGESFGGPPTTFTWRRNGAVITANSSHGISIAAEERAYHESRYRSTLTVTGHFPGEYQYSVTNRATTSTINRRFSIESKLIILCTCIRTLLKSIAGGKLPPQDAQLFPKLLFLPTRNVIITQCACDRHRLSRNAPPPSQGRYVQL